MCARIQCLTGHFNPPHGPLRRAVASCTVYVLLIFYGNQLNASPTFISLSSILFLGYSTFQKYIYTCVHVGVKKV